NETLEERVERRTKQLALEITERRQMQEQAQYRMQRLADLHEINDAISSSLDLRAVLDLLIGKIDALLPYASVLVWLSNEDKGLLDLVASKNFNEEECRERKMEAKFPLLKAVMENKSPVTTSNIQTDPRCWEPDFFRQQGLVSYLGVPMIAEGEVLGVLSFFTRKEHEFSDEEVEFLSMLAGQAAVAIHNSQLHEQAKKHLAELVRANRVKDEFLSVMSHELRTPLNVVVGYVGMIQDGRFGEINDRQNDALEKVTRQSNNLLSMINSIMETTKIEAGAVMLETQEVNLSNFLDEFRSSYSHSDNGVKLTWDYPSNLPVVKVDSDKLKQILQNLINNALKFTPKGTVTVSARYIAGIKTVKLRVKDTGIGIPENGLPIIFERFRQLDSSETRSYGGVGLGLYIVKRFTELLGGRVDVNSKARKGSTFTVTIPYEP
ncbi:MAG: ATP-binding protein, partial [Candidatus Binatia bacterium]